MLESGTYVDFMFRTSVTLLPKRRLQNRRLELEFLRPVVQQSICAIFHALPALPSVDNRDECQVSVAALQRSATASRQVFLAHFHLEPHPTRPDAAVCLGQPLATSLSRPP